MKPMRPIGPMTPMRYGKGMKPPPGLGEKVEEKVGEEREGGKGEGRERGRGKMQPPPKMPKVPNMVPGVRRYDTGGLNGFGNGMAGFKGF